MPEVQFVTEPPPELTLDRAPELNTRFPHIMALDLPGIILRQWASNIHELVDRVKNTVTDFDLRYLDSADFRFRTAAKGYGRGLHNDPDPSPDGARRINVTFVREGTLDATMFAFSPGLKALVIAGRGKTLLMPPRSPHAALYKRGLVDIDWLSAFAFRGILEVGDGLVFADVNAHNFTHPSFPRISVAHLLEAKPKRRFSI